ncbi:MAG: Adapter protein MecA 2 [Firmicutes bacterium ADurb.Bin193]|nr:MAG: Adapter protein MecA 2 [Firmicutes bacterium ADurb.Bin193]
MKIERIAPNKIKVTLSIDDLKEWDVSFESLTYNSPEAQDLFWNLIHRAEVEAGFYANGSQLVVEAMPIKNDGFVMIITRIEEGEDNPVQKYLRPRVKKDVKTRRRPRVLVSPVVYEFKSFDDVVEACKNIETRFSGMSSLYKYNQQFYITFHITNELVLEDLDVILTEYAVKDGASAHIRTGELAEHGMLLIENNAVETISSHF